MGLRCLLGHDFGEPELQREREEEGDEVVTTVKEVKTCARCGETQIVSENTEVTTMEQLADEVAANAAGGSDAGAAATPEGGSGPAPTEGSTPGTASGADGADDAATGTGGLTLDEEPEAGSDDAVILDDDADDAGDEAPETAAGASPEGSDAPASASERSDAAGAPDASGGPDPADEDAELLDAGEESASASSASAASSSTDAASESESSDETDAESDDGVILDEGGEDADDRERGAWPEVDEDEADGDGSAAWPDHGGEDEGFSAEVGEGGDAGVEFGGGLTPEAADRQEEEDGGETEYVEAPDDTESVAFDAGDEGETGITRGESPELETIGDDGPTEYYCPECGMVRAADGSSMRAGDICPECKRGYVDERPQ
ncbi:MULTISPECIES: DUF7093 family protein [Halorubrum]|uniref:Uncharacterized protein n=1 Tax=Halorubrum ruber TaxID=2982524 RepID=A0A8T8LML4_9EURY|nr:MULTISPECIES: hypothetical protein [Halorubrum]QUO47984.1 hypothetical protein J7656_01030 [Halorubrum ruber]